MADFSIVNRYESGLAAPRWIKNARKDPRFERNRPLSHTGKPHDGLLLLQASVIGYEVKGPL